MMDFRQRDAATIELIPGQWNLSRLPLQLKTVGAFTHGASPQIDAAASLALRKEDAFVIERVVGAVDALLAQRGSPGDRQGIAPKHPNQGPDAATLSICGADPGTGQLVEDMGEESAGMHR